MHLLAQHLPIVTDGAGDRYRVVSVRMAFTLQSEQNGRLVQVDEYTLRKLGVDFGPAFERIAETHEEPRR